MGFNAKAFNAKICHIVVFLLFHKKEIKLVTETRFFFNFNEENKLKIKFVYKLFKSIINYICLHDSRTK